MSQESGGEASARVLVVPWAACKAKPGSSASVRRVRATFNPALDIAGATRPGSYALTSTDDPNYAQPAKPSRVFRKSKVNGTTNQWPEPPYTVEHTIFLELPNRVQQGKHYTPNISPAVNTDTRSSELAFDVYSSVSEAVHVNIIAYQQDQTAMKSADLYMWMGDGGARDYSSYVGKAVTLSGRPFTVVGVMPAGVQHVGGDYRSMPHGETVDAWWPTALRPQAGRGVPVLLDAIDRNDLADLRDELGDLLLQVAFHARMAEEQGVFDFGDVVETITGKLIRRHPHVFADAEGRTAEAVEGLWERIKAEEKAEKGEPGPTGALAGVPVVLPALTRALKLQDKASKVGFDWNDPRAVLAKVREEADEIEAELDRADKAKVSAEVGDLLFAVVNLARHLGADPEDLLRQTNLKFERRFAVIESALAARGKTPKDASLAEMDALWDAAKADENKV